MAITYYLGLVTLLAKTGIGFDEIFDAVNEWLARQRQVMVRPAVDPANGIRIALFCTRSRTGRPIGLAGRRSGRDIEIYAAYYLSAAQIAEFEKWEATHND